MNTSSPSSTGQLLSSLPGKVLLASVLGVVGIAILWLVAGFLSLTLLAHAVPLLASDLHDASWLGSPTTALHFSTGPLAYGLCGATAVVGLAMAVAKKTPVPAITGLCFAGALLFGASEEASVRVGLLDGTVRIGCFVPESADCRAMLDLLKKDGARSMYPASGDTAQFAPWYATRRSEVTSAETNFRTLFYVLPGGALLRAPLYLGESSRLQDLVQSQRRDVAKLRTANR